MKMVQKIILILGKIQYVMKKIQNSNIFGLDGRFGKKKKKNQCTYGELNYITNKFHFENFNDI